MLTAVLVVAIIGIAMLAVAVVTENTIVAVIVIALAAVGLVLLGREWMRERRLGEPTRETDPEQIRETPHQADIEADEFEPDVLDEEPDASTEETAEDTHRENEYH